MNLLQTVADTLIREGIVRNYSEFSRIFCKKTENYYYRQKHFGRDFSRDGLIHVAIQLSRANRHYNQYVVFESEQAVLTTLEKLTKEELLNKYRIKELVM
jgi:hypothetical protein